MYVSKIRKRKCCNGLGQFDFITSAMKLLDGGGGSAGGSSSMLPQVTTVSPQISPQISPVFQQQFQPQNSPQSAGTSQSLPSLPGTVFSGPYALPAAYSPSYSPVYTPGLVDSAAIPDANPASGASFIPGVSNSMLPWVLGGSVLALVLLAKR